MFGNGREKKVGVVSNSVVLTWVSFFFEMYIPNFKNVMFVYMLFLDLFPPNLSFLHLSLHGNRNPVLCLVMMSLNRKVTTRKQHKMGLEPMWGNMLVRRVESNLLDHPASQPPVLILPLRESCLYFIQPLPESFLKLPGWAISGRMSYLEWICIQNLQHPSIF